MHENIKFTVRLTNDIKPLEDIDLVRKIPEEDTNGVYDYIPPSLEKKAEVADWQPICGDVAYGTDYTIYAKFLWDDKLSGPQPNSTGFTINNIQLYIQNYKGPVSIGFNDQDVRIKKVLVPEHKADGDPRYPNRIQYVMMVGLQGLNSEMEDLFVCDPARIKTEDETVGYIDLSKAPIELKEGDALMVETWFSPADPNITKVFTTKAEMKDAAFVDEKFMERFGEDIVVSWKGLLELKWMRATYPGVISETQFKKATKNRTKRSQTIVSERDFLGDPDPCQRTHSKFHIG